MPDSHTIAENLTRLQTARTNIATAITTKGGTVASGAGFEDFPTAIGTIPAGGGGSDTINSARAKTPIAPTTGAHWLELLAAWRVYGYDVWTDGTNIYYSHGTNQQAMSASGAGFSTKTWTGLTDFDGNNVWTDGTDIYYSNDTNQYVLDKATSTWSSKTWNGLTSFTGNSVWTDGTDIYYSYQNNQYVLDKSTSTWSTKTWTDAPTSVYGSQIWTDGTNIFFTNNQHGYMLRQPMPGITKL